MKMEPVNYPRYKQYFAIYLSLLEQGFPVL